MGFAYSCDSPRIGCVAGDGESDVCEAGEDRVCGVAGDEVSWLTDGRDGDSSAGCDLARESSRGLETHGVFWEEADIAGDGREFGRAVFESTGGENVAGIGESV